MQLARIIIFVLMLPATLIAQEKTDTIVEHEELDPVKLNFIFSYYEQDGVHSPVTGGIGDEELHDYIGKIAVYIPMNKKLNLNVSVGVDYYTSASTDNINDEHDLLVAETSASYRDARGYGDASLQLEAADGRIILGGNAGFSREWDVRSYNAGLMLAGLSKNENTKVKLGAFYYNDVWEMIYPLELRESIIEDEDSVKELFDVSVSLTRIINKRLKASLSIEAVIQKGLLSTPFHRVYFSDTTHTIEHLPNLRFKLPIGLHATYYLNDWSIVRFYYRYYSDDFGIKAHTIELETPLKILPFIVLSPFYRFHTQTESDYFEAFAVHDPDAQYYTSDYDLAALKAHKFGIGFKYAPLFGFLNKFDLSKEAKKVRFKKLEFRASKYFRMDETGVTLKAFIATLGITYNIK